MKKLICGAFAAALLGSAALPALAADLPSTKAAPVLAPIDDSFGPFLVRLRGLAVLPDASGTTLAGKTLNGAALSDQGIPEADFTYFFNKHWAVEAIAGFYYAHRLTAAQGAVLGLNAANQGIANSTLLPPTVSLQYHFALGQWDPYVGVDANYTWFLWTKSALGAQLGNANIINIHSNAGVAFEAGFDYYLTKHWVLNVDAKYLLLTTTADMNVAGVGLNAVHVNVNPRIVVAPVSAIALAPPIFSRRPSSPSTDLLLDI
jgi:outer membrane protein